MTTYSIQNQKDGKTFLTNFLIYLFFLFNLLLLPLFKYKSLNSSIYDLGIYLNSFYNISKNHLYEIAITGHFELILIPLSYIYKIFNFSELGVIVILFIQTLSLISISLFFFFKKKIKISLLLLSFFPLSYINLFDFHTDVLTIPVFLIFLIFKKNNPKIAVIAILSLSLIKEYYVVVTIISLLYMIQENYISRRYAITLIIMSAFIFLLQMIILNHNSNEIPAIGNLYQSTNQILNIKDKVFNFFILFIFCILPTLFLIKKKNLKFIVFILLPYIIYDNENVLKFNYQYFIPLFLILILCIYEELNYLDLLKRKFFYSLIFINLILSVNILSPIFLFNNDTIYSHRNFIINKYNHEIIKYINSLDLKEYKVITSNNYLNYHKLSNILVIHSFPDGVINKVEISKEKRKFFDSEKIFSDIVFFDLNKDKDIFVNDDTANEKILKFFLDREFNLKLNRGNFYVFERR